MAAVRREGATGVLAGSAAVSPGPDRGRVIGLPVSVGSMATVTQEIVRLARRGAGAHVCVANVHMLVEARRDPALREVLRSAEIVVSDGRPLVWQLRRSGFAHAQQVRGPELMLRVCEAAAAEGLPVYFYGGDADLMAELRVALEHRVPELRIAGMEPAPMLPRQPQVDPATVERMRAAGARVVFVGLGCPKQEFWMAAHRAHLPAVLVGVGQAFGIAAGLLPEAPEWMRRAGLEWLFRLGLEPRRLWRRYLVTNSLFIAFTLREAAVRLVRPSGS
jgi:N-acetylglucosaminyldiphosphoundecaprenol N-acetyl-beta-D-mannosaminyltransferase